MAYLLLLLAAVANICSALVAISSLFLKHPLLQQASVAAIAIAAQQQLTDSQLPQHIQWQAHLRAGQPRVRVSRQ
jgi:hypothetical protein